MSKRDSSFEKNLKDLLSKDRDRRKIEIRNAYVSPVNLRKIVPNANIKSKLNTEG